MYQAKDFYLMTGLTRASVRYYTELGLLHPEERENGYRTYGEEDLVNAILIRSFRALDYSGSGILELFGSSAAKQVQSLRETKRELQEKIRVYESRIRVLGIYTDILEQYEDTETVTLMDPIPLRSFFLQDVAGGNRRLAGEEIAHCINAQPFVHMTAKGSYEDFMAGRDVTLHPGYEYRTDRGDFVPLHGELYREVPAERVLLQRLRVSDPLHLGAEELRVLREKVETCGAVPAGTLLAGISCMVREEGQTKYCVSVRVPLRREE